MKKDNRMHWTVRTTGGAKEYKISTTADATAKVVAFVFTLKYTRKDVGDIVEIIPEEEE